VRVFLMPEVLMPRVASRLSLVSALIGSVLLAGGCQSGPPSGSTGGRIDPYRTTESDRRSDKASIPELLQFTDQAAEKFAAEVAKIPEVKQADTRLVMELGSIQNRTDTPTGDFEQIQRRLRSKLMSSDLITDRFMVVESRRRMNREMDRVQGEDRDLLQEGEKRESAKYDPEITYVLQGDFYESERGDRRQYFFNFKLVNLASRSIVFNEDYDLAQVTGR